MKRPTSSAAIVVASLLGSHSCAGFTTTISNGYRVGATQCNAAKPDNGENAIGRRDLLDNMIRLPIATAAAAAFSVSFSVASASQPALALDFNAFESSVLSKDSIVSKPELNDDEALCKYGAPGKAMGEACQRAGMKPRLPGVVDASGKVDRGDYLKCAYEYPVIDGQYVKTRVCKPSSEWGPP